MGISPGPTTKPRVDMAGVVGATPGSRWLMAGVGGSEGRADGGPDMLAVGGGTGRRPNAPREWSEGECWSPPGGILVPANILKL